MPETVSDIASAARLWELSDVTAIADSPTSLVYRAHQTKQSVIVKILKPAGLEEATGMDFLRWRGGKGAIRVLAQQDNAYLLEDGGNHTVREYYNHRGDREAVWELRNAVRHLHTQSPAPYPQTLVPLELHFLALFDATANSVRGEHAILFDWARQLARRLLAAQTYVRPLHGDIHHGNLVSPVIDAGWKAIDPKGLIGDPAYDFANIFGNPVDEPDKVLAPERCLWLASELCWSPSSGSDFHRDLTELKLLHYAAVHSVLSACWSLEGAPSAQDVQNATQRLALAEILKSLIEGRNR